VEDKAVAAVLAGAATTGLRVPRSDRRPTLLPSETERTDTLSHDDPHDEEPVTRLASPQRDPAQGKSPQTYRWILGFVNA